MSYIDSILGAVNSWLCEKEIRFFERFTGEWDTGSRSHYTIVMDTLLPLHFATLAAFIGFAVMLTTTAIYSVVA